MIYALGGGWGHFTRALSLARMAADRHYVKIITNSPYVLCPHEWKIGNREKEKISIELIPPNAGYDVTCQQAQQILLHTRYNCLIVDTFPRGLGGELAEILPQLKHIPRVLIHRDIKPDYVQAKDLRSFVAENFNAVIVPGDGENLPLADLPIVQHTNPWLIRNREELPSLSKARSLLQLSDNNNSQPVILICSSGKESELTFFIQLATKLANIFPHVTLRFITPNQNPKSQIKNLQWISYWPVIECLQAANLVVGGGGYNTVYECAALGVPLVAFAFPRLYDRQDRRVSRSNLKSVYLVENINSAIATIKIILNQQPSQISSPPNYQNGAMQAVNLIDLLPTNFC